VCKKIIAVPDFSPDEPVSVEHSSSQSTQMLAREWWGIKIEKPKPKEVGALAILAVTGLLFSLCLWGGWQSSQRNVGPPSHPTVATAQEHTPPPTRERKWADASQGMLRKFDVGVTIDRVEAGCQAVLKRNDGRSRAMDGEYLFVHLVITNLGASGEVNYNCWGTSRGLAVEDNKGRKYNVLRPSVEYRFTPVSNFDEYFEKPAGQTPIMRQLDIAVDIKPGYSVGDVIVFRDVPRDQELEYLRLELPHEAYRAPGGAEDFFDFHIPRRMIHWN
jgi:hypothetical protein